MNIAIFQCVRGELDQHILKFCIVKNYNGRRDPIGFLLLPELKTYISWIAHDFGHNRIYWSKNENISV